MKLPLWIFFIKFFFPKSFRELEKDAKEFKEARNQIRLKQVEIQKLEAELRRLSRSLKKYEKRGPAG